MGRRRQPASDVHELLGQVRCGTPGPPEAGEAGLRRGVHALPLPLSRLSISLQYGASFLVTLCGRDLTGDVRTRPTTRRRVH
jgi:hypothetical protein